jgi:hypothetical protein
MSSIMDIYVRLTSNVSVSTPAISVKIDCFRNASSSVDVLNTVESSNFVSQAALNSSVRCDLISVRKATIDNAV